MALALVAVAVALAVLPAPAGAHGPVDPVATSYLARIDRVPAAVDAKVVDGYVRMWMSVPATETVEVLDYGGAPYLRFSSRGVQVNENSPMYYFNQTPAHIPPGNLTAQTPPAWHRVSAGHAYEWHDGRLQALASVALDPGRSYVGRWSIAIRVNGRLAALSGGLWHAGDPPIVWFWPILVLLGCVFAALRVRALELDARVARALAIVSLIAIAAAAEGRALHGRPSVSTAQWAEAVIVAGFLLWGVRHVVFGEPGYFGYFVIGSIALWEGLNLLPTLLHGYVLIALPAFVARAATVLCLGCGAAIFWPAFRLATDRPGPVRTLQPQFELDSQA